MDERSIIKSERYNVGRGLLVFFIVIAILCAIMFISEFSSELEYCQNRWDDCYYGHRSYCIHKYYSSPTVAALDYSDRTTIYIAGGVGVICLLIYAWLRSYEIIVTDKRVYGKTAFGKRVDLPMDSISAVGSRWPKGIAVATSSGKIAFLIIKNRDEIHKCVSDLLIERQTKPTATTAIKQEASKSDAEELKKYKELLDSGIITQEEFDAKKKQLLGL